MDRDGQLRLFEDRRGRRLMFWRAVTLTLLFLMTFWIGDFVWRAHSLPPLPEQQEPAETAADEQLRFTDLLLRDTTVSPECAVMPRTSSERTVFGYIPAHDPRAAASLDAHCEMLDAVLVDAFSFGGRDGAIAPQPRPSLPDGMPVYLLFKPDPAISDDRLAALLQDPVARSSLSNNIVHATEDAAAAGFCIDLTGRTDLGGATLAPLMTGLAREDGGRIGETCIVAEADAAVWTDPGLISSLDRAIVIGFRKVQAPYSPLAPQDWFADIFTSLAGVIPDEKLTVALGTFGQWWQSGSTVSRTVSFATAVWLSSTNGATPTFAEPYGNTLITFLDAQRRVNHVWLLDAVSLYNQLHLMPTRSSVALWPLGTEDPGIWSVLGSWAADATGPATSTFDPPVDVGSHLIALGDGPVIARVETARPGARRIRFGPDGLVSEATYRSLPSPHVEHRRGNSGPVRIALTFNGVVPGESLETLLETMRARNIGATFFLNDLDILRAGPELGQIIAGGHQIGLQVPTVDGTNPIRDALRGFSIKVSEQALLHNASQRALFVRDLSADMSLPQNLQALQSLHFNTGQHRVAVANGIPVPPNADDLAEVIEQARETGALNGIAILTLDLNSSTAPETVAALPAMLDMLLSDGFGIADLKELTAPEPSQVEIPTANLAPVRDAINHAVMHFWAFHLSTLFFVLLLFAAVRSLIYLVLALLRRSAPRSDGSFAPPVTVIIPAYNESKVIVGSIGSVLASNYRNLEIIVIDDGSSDNTSQTVRDAYGSHPHVKVLSQQNGGKWRAANHALDHVTTPFFIGVDADTKLHPDAIAHLVQQFRDPEVGAVAGFVEVGNRGGFLTACQSLEYMVSQAVTKRAFEMFNGILVVPGAIGAWRMDAVAKAGLYSGETITEDADLTIASLRAGYAVKFQENARAYTEAPERVTGFLKQRLRWTLGMLQASWKHRGAIVEGRAIGVISILDAIWFSILTSILAPIVDLLLLKLGLEFAFAALAGTDGPGGVLPVAVIVSYFALVTIDVLNTLASFAFERRFDWKLLVLTPVLRFGYRQLLYLATLTALKRSLTGQIPGWNKLDRNASGLLMPDNHVTALPFASVRRVPTAYDKAAE